eukprot:Gb_18521 [translate_table: standard]
MVWRFLPPWAFPVLRFPFCWAVVFVFFLASHKFLTTARDLLTFGCPPSSVAGLQGTFSVLGYSMRFLVNRGFSPQGAIAHKTPVSPRATPPAPLGVEVNGDVLLLKLEDRICEEDGNEAELKESCKPHYRTYGAQRMYKVKPAIAEDFRQVGGALGFNEREGFDHGCCDIQYTDEREGRMAEAMEYLEKISEKK